MPETPTIDQEPNPVGVAPVGDPETVAVNVKVEPRERLAALEVTTTRGITRVTVTLAEPFGEAAV